MRLKDVFKARHKFAREIFYDDLREDWSESQLRRSVHPSMNSLVWVMWHVARVEDAGVMRFVARQPQLFQTGDWKNKLKIEFEHFGFGMVYKEMRTLSETIDLGALQSYWDAVIEQTYAVVDALTEAQMDEILSDEEVEQVMVFEGVGAESVGTNVPYSGWTRLEALFHFSVTHYYWHGGEVRTIEGLLLEEAKSNQTETD
ncbi:MAG: DinB family protein [Anaerolineae bacterium]